MTKLYQNLKIDKKTNGLVKIEGEVPVDVFEKHIGKRIKEIQKHFEMPGFRKGHVPEDIVRKNANKDALLDSAAEKALQEAYGAVLEDNRDLEVMSAPRANITKLAEGNPLGFKVEVAVVPEIKLPDYKKIAEEIIKSLGEDDLSVKNEEVENTIKQIQAVHANEETKKVPEINDDFVRSLGEFENVEDFKNKIKGNISLEKKILEGKKRREKIAEKLLEETEIPIADIAIDTEIGYAVERLKGMLDELNMTIEEYVKNSGKKLEDLLEEEKKYIIKQLKSQIIFAKIAESEKIKVSKEELEEEMKRTLSRHPGVAGNPESLKEYVEKLIKNEKVLKILEGGAE